MRNHGTPGTDYVPPVNEAVALPTPELATITLTNPQSFEKLLLDTRRSPSAFTEDGVDLPLGPPSRRCPR